MPKRHYALAIACYLAIPLVILAGAAVFRLIDPEMARGHADYVRVYWLLEKAQTGALMAAWGLTVVLWIATCYLVLRSRQRSPWWLALSATGPLGFTLIAALKDRSPAPGDLYQQFIHKLKIYWRVPLEVALFLSIWTLTYQFVVLKRNLMINYESFSTGTPVQTIIDRQKRIQRHVGGRRRDGAVLPGGADLSALAGLVQSCRPAFQTARTGR
jgi:hypothetical protein